MSVAAVDATPVQEELRAVGERVFDRIRVEVLIDGVPAIMAAAERLGLDRPGILHPAAVIDDVNVEVVEAPAAGPNEAVEASNLPQQLTRIARPFVRERRSHRPAHAVSPHQHDIADLAVVDALAQLFAGAAAWRDIKPTPTLRFFAPASSASLSMRREVGPSAVTGFSMKTFSPFWMA